MTVKEARVAKLKRQYPHVDDMQDWRGAQSVRLLWDRVFDLEERLVAREQTIKMLVAAQNQTESTLHLVEMKALEALAIAQHPADAIEDGGVGGGGGGEGELPGGGDGGEANEGVAASGDTGHVGPGPLSPFRAGEVIGGTGKEFAGLLVATPDEDTRLANAEELILRMIWHLRMAGYTAGRQQNPSLAISKDKLCVEVDGVLRAYDCFIGKGDWATDMQVAANEVGGATMIEDPGIAD